MKYLSWPPLLSAALLLIIVRTDGDDKPQHRHGMDRVYITPQASRDMLKLVIVADNFDHVDRMRYTRDKDAPRLVLHWKRLLNKMYNLVVFRVGGKFECYKVAKYSSGKVRIEEESDGLSIRRLLDECGLLKHNLQDEEIAELENWDSIHKEDDL